VPGTAILSPSITRTITAYPIVITFRMMVVIVVTIFSGPARVIEPWFDRQESTFVGSATVVDRDPWISTSSAKRASKSAVSAAFSSVKAS
jgi:hypothetical protein